MTERVEYLLCAKGLGLRAERGGMSCCPASEGCSCWPGQQAQPLSCGLSLTAEEDKFFSLLRLYLNSGLIASEQENNLFLHIKLGKSVGSEQAVYKIMCKQGNNS